MKLKITTKDNEKIVVEVNIDELKRFESWYVKSNPEDVGVLTYPNGSKVAIKSREISFYEVT